MEILNIFLFVHYVSITLDSDMKSRMREMSNRGHCYTADKILTSPRKYYLDSHLEINTVDALLFYVLMD